MTTANTVWGIDVGQCALKALKLIEVEGGFRTEAFEVIEHSSVLSQPDVDVSLVIRNTLDEFLRRVDLSGSKISVSVLGQSSFTRFVKLPPVEKSKIPDIVRFEAEQQIPFPIGEVTWRYQIFQAPDSPEVEAGIFAMKQVDVAEMLSYFVEVGLDVDLVQMAPLALYNFMAFDGKIAPNGATMLADVGADKTHLVVSDGSKIWNRTIQIGGDNFTNALVKSFKLSFAKAEKLKRTAAASKYARQIFQVMRPVFADLVQEIQRSIGYYTSLNRDSRFKQLVGMGNGFRLPGMQKYLEQNLNMAVTRVEKFSRLSSEAPNFKEHVLSLGVAYGLAVQGADQAVVQTNLLPGSIARKRLWGQKRPWFIAIAASVLLAVGLFVFRSYGDRSALQGREQEITMGQTKTIIDKLERWRSQEKSIGKKVEKEQRQIVENLGLRSYSRTWPAINTRIAAALLQTMTTPKDREILREFPTADSARQEELASQVQSDQARLKLIGMLPYRNSPTAGKKTLREKLFDQLKSKDRQNREILIIEGQASKYEPILTANSLDKDEKEEEKSDTKPNSRSRRPGASRRTSSSRRNDRKTVTRREEKPRGFQIKLNCWTSMGDIQAIPYMVDLRSNLQAVVDADPDLEVVGAVTTEYPTDADAKGGSSSSNKRSSRRSAGGSTRRRPTMGRPTMGRPPMMERPTAGRPTAGRPRTLGRRPSIGANANEGLDAEEQIDPRFACRLFPDESIEKDVVFTLTIQVAVTGSGFEDPTTETKKKSSRRNR